MDWIKKSEWDFLQEFKKQKQFEFARYFNDWLESQKVRKKFEEKLKENEHSNKDKI